MSRATLFNYFERDTPPPGKKKIEKLRQYLGKDAGWILDSVQSNQPNGPEDYVLSDSEAAQELGEPPPPKYKTKQGAAAVLRAKIYRHVDGLLAAAGDDLQRLGWIAEELDRKKKQTDWDAHAQVDRHPLKDQPLIAPPDDVTGFADIHPPEKQTHRAR